MAKDEIESKEAQEAIGENPERKEEDPAELREQLLRLAAEFDNYKKRIRKELDGAESAGKMALITGLLPIVDEFELAMLAINGSKDNVGKGIEMLYSNFIDQLKREGLKEIDSRGIFDPHKHEIVMVKESDKKEGTILEVVKTGYMFDDRLLRPAAVIISKGKETDNEKNNDNLK